MRVGFLRQKVAEIRFSRELLIRFFVFGFYILCPIRPVAIGQKTLVLLLDTKKESSSCLPSRRVSIRPVASPEEFEDSS